MTDVHFVSATLEHPDLDSPLVRDVLGAGGIDARIVDWRDPAVDWGSAPLTVIRSPWDYVHHLDEFLAWIDRVAGASTLWNPAPVLTWNIHKAYLLELHAGGAPVVPTVVLLRESAASFDGILDAQGWNAAVVKPAVSFGGIGAGRFTVGDPAGQSHLDGLLRTGDVLVQRYMASVETAGELSLIVIDGVATHAVRKRPAAGDYRIHPMYGGTDEQVEMPPALVELGQRLLELVPEPVMYARVDVVELDGLYHVIELEVLEPYLWLGARPGLVQTFADAVARRLDMAR